MTTKVEAPVWIFEIWTVQELMDHVTYKRLKADPIGNRPSSVADDGNAKNIGIVESIFQALGISTIILRDITNVKRLKSMYGNSYKYAVIDGGHRTRALKWFIGERFAIKLKGSKKKFFWKDLDKEIQDKILNTKIPISIVTCDNKQAREIFVNHNKQTKVKGYSIIMADEESKICEFVRQQTKTWREYGTTCHQIFDVNANGNPLYFHGTAPNADNLWDTYVIVAGHKVEGKGNVAAGEEQTIELINKTTAYSKKTQSEIIKFLDTLLEVCEYNERAITLPYFGCFQTVYFELYGQCDGNMQIEGMQTFAYKFQDALDVLLDPKSKATIIMDDLPVNRASFLKTNSIAFSKADVQKRVAEIVLNQMYA